MCCARARWVSVVALVTAAGCGEILAIDEGDAGDGSRDAGAGAEAATEAEGAAPAPPVQAGLLADANAGLSGKGPIAFYMFLEGDGGVIHDLAPPSEDLILSSGTYEWSGQGLKLLGTLAQGDAGGIREACEKSGALSVEAWITPTDASQRGPARIVTMSSDGQAHNFLLGLGKNEAANQDSSEYAFRFRPGNTSVPAVTSPSAEATIQHVVATVDETSAHLYVNGQPVNNAPNGAWSSWFPLPLAIGGEPGSGGSFFFYGTYSFVAIYDRALDPDEVATRFRYKPR